MPDILTIGVYGWDAARFFEALRENDIDTFCDIRARRGVRGSEYAFANNQRLQARLGELGIRYVHRPELAPSHQMREVQHLVDDATGTGKRQRTGLSPAFVAAYEQEMLADFDSTAFIASLGSPCRRIVLMCVEGWPAACHRSLLAARLAADLHLEVIHLTP